MARLHHVKKSRKAYPDDGIGKGEPYYWWQFAYGTKQRSKTKPARSRLTRSEFYAQMYDLEDSLDGLHGDDPEQAAQVLRDMAEAVRELGDEQEEKVDNMPESLQESETADLLRERQEACETISGELDAAADRFEDEDYSEDADDILSTISWDYS